MRSFKLLELISITAIMLTTWSFCLERAAHLELDYRKPYNTRHTFISHALDKGMNPVEVAQLTGHDVQTLYENYAGVVNSRPRLPELL